MIRNAVVELHMLIPYGPSNLNRNDIGEQKSAFIGNEPRAIVSSACKHHPIRASYEDYYHTRLIVEEINRRYKEKYGKECDFEKIHPAFAKEIGEKGAIISVSDAEINYIVDHYHEFLPKSSKDKSEDLKEAIVNNAPINRDIALFGRMSTAGFGLSVTSAARRNYMYSVDRYTGDVDTIVATDSLQTFFKGEDATGSAHMTTLSFGSNTYYGYTSVDIGQLIKNYKTNNFDGSDEELKAEIVDAVMEYLIKYIAIHPSAKQSTMAAMPVPVLLYVTVGENVQQITFDSVFEKVINANPSKSVGEIGTERVLNYLVNDRPSFKDGKYLAQTMYLASNVNNDKIEDVISNLTDVNVEHRMTNMCELKDVESAIMAAVNDLI